MARCCSTSTGTSSTTSPRWRSPSCAAAASRRARPQRTFGTPDHYVPTSSRDYATIADPEKRVMAQALITDSAAAGITSLGLDDPRQGIVHVVGPEQGLSWPGTTIVCARQPHVDARRTRRARVRHRRDGDDATSSRRSRCGSAGRRRCGSRSTAASADGVCAKDVVLAIIARIGAAGAAGHVIEYAGSAITGLSMEGRAHRLQHVDRGRRTRGHDRSRRHDVRVPRRPSLRAGRA